MPFLPMSAPDLHIEAARAKASVMTARRGSRAPLRSVAAFALTFLFLGCEIERTSSRSEPEGAQASPVPNPAAAPTSLSEALSRSPKKKVHQEEPAAPPAPPPALQEDAPEPETETLPPGRPLSELPEWVRGAAWWSPGAGDDVHRLLLVYGGGAAVKALHLPESTAPAAQDSVVAIVEQLEQSPLTNAGRGAARRLDGSVEVEALLRQGDGRVGGVFGATKIRSPIHLAAALARAGGAQIRGSAAERLASKLELDLLPLETAESQEQYVQDLARSLEEGHTEDNRALFHLFVDPRLTADALKRKQALPEAPPRDPIVVVLSTKGGELLFAASHGGTPLSLPGSKSLLQGDRAIASDERRVAFLFSKEACNYDASQLLTPWNQLLPLLRRVEKECPKARYLVVEDAKIETNLPADTFARASLPRAEDPPSVPGKTSPAAPSSSSNAPPAGSPVKTPSAGSGTKTAPGGSSSPPAAPAPAPTQSPPKPASGEGVDSTRGVQR